MALSGGSFKKGVARHPDAGRKTGTPNKRDVQMLESLERLGCNPFEFLALVITEKLIDKDGTLVPVTLDQRMVAAKELCPYLLPKQKALEVSGALTVNVTPAEEAAQQSIEQLAGIIDHTQKAIEQSNA